MCMLHINTLNQKYYKLCKRISIFDYNNLFLINKCAKKQYKLFIKRGKFRPKLIRSVGGDVKC